jgi:hypothetical protein
VTLPTVPETPTDSAPSREATVMAFSGGSPPNRTYLVTTTKCSQGHDLTDPANFYLTPTRTKKTCLPCRLQYIEYWRTQLQPAAVKRRADEKARVKATYRAHREAQRAGRKLIRDAREIAKRRAR